jgi:hypothetical protein
MKNSKLSIARFFCLSGLLCLLLVGGHAQGQSNPQQTEEFRQQMTKLLNLLPILSPNKPDIRSTLSQLQEDFGKLPYGQLAEMASTFDLPKFSKAVSDLSEATTRRLARAAFRQMMTGANTEGHPLDPPGYDACGTTRSDTQEGLDLLSTIQALENAIPLLEYLCNVLPETITIAGNSVPNVLKPLTCNTVTLAKGAKIAVEIVKGRYDFCDSVIGGNETLSILLNTQHLHGDIADNHEVVTTQINAKTMEMVTAIDAATKDIKSYDDANRVVLFNRLEALSVELADFRADNLRLVIESNLISESRYTHARFFLPQSAGGHLELVREIVADTIATQKKAGLGGSPIEQAEAALAAGDDAYKRNNYKQAYANYRLAYLNITILPTVKQP